MFNRVSHANLTLKPTKCRLGCQEVNFLGYIMTNKGILSIKMKVEIISNVVRPQNKWIFNQEQCLSILSHFVHSNQKNFPVPLCKCMLLICLVRHETLYLDQASWLSGKISAS